MRVLLGTALVLIVPSVLFVVILVVLLVLVMKIIMIDLLRLGKDLIRWL